MRMHYGPDAAEGEKAALRREADASAAFRDLVTYHDDIDPAYIFDLVLQFRDQCQSPLDARRWFYSNDCTIERIVDSVARDLLRWRMWFNDHLVPTCARSYRDDAWAFAILEQTLTVSPSMFKLEVRIDALITVRSRHVQTFMRGISQNLIGSYQGWSQWLAKRFEWPLGPVLINLDRLEAAIRSEAEESGPSIREEFATRCSEGLDVWLALAAQHSTGETSTACATA